MISPAPYILNGVDGSIISVAQQLHIATLDHRNYHHHHHHFLQHINQYNDHNLNHNPIQNLHSPDQLRYARCYDNQSVSPLYSPTKSHNTIMHDDDIPSAFVRTPILRLPSAADTFHHATDMVKKCDQKFTTKQPDEIAPRKSFALENLIESGASTPSNEPNMLLVSEILLLDHNRSSSSFHNLIVFASLSFKLLS
ncbi:unnamed protein product [Anisakis simplex]|uniref:Uncharacterized protein n=1 Tax=Anisakis simplex TaxID=6269 RepID=A0A0M3K8N5_ANISI|nr:unnamed protein product [Anisakis simplex]